jgi:hypothetical protein
VRGRAHETSRTKGLSIENMRYPKFMSKNMLWKEHAAKLRFTQINLKYAKFRKAINKNTLSRKVQNLASNM